MRRNVLSYSVVDEMPTNTIISKYNYSYPKDGSIWTPYMVHASYKCTRKGLALKIFEDIPREKDGPNTFLDILQF